MMAFRGEFCENTVSMDPSAGPGGDCGPGEPPGARPGREAERGDGSGFAALLRERVIMRGGVDSCIGVAGRGGAPAGGGEERVEEEKEEEREEGRGFFFLVGAECDGTSANADALEETERELESGGGGQGGGREAGLRGEGEKMGACPLEGAGAGALAAASELVVDPIWRRLGRGGQGARGGVSGVVEVERLRVEKSSI